MDVVDRFPLFPLAFTFLAFPLLAWVTLRLLPARIRIAAFAILNSAGLAVMCWLSGAKGVRAAFVVPYTRAAVVFFALYVGVVLAHYASLRMSRGKRIPWTVAFLLPIAVLIYVKYAPQALSPFSILLAPAHLDRFVGFFIGISYLSFRLVLLAQEVRNDVVAMPDLWEYLSFAFFVPTLSIGPISRYSLFIASLRKPDRAATPIDGSFLRIVLGFTKYIFLGSLCAQLTYGGLLRDGHPHAWIDLAVAILCYPLFLYANFSGYCDMVIGTSGLLGIQVSENFDRPFFSRNFQEFWTRWHITLSLWIRDIVFTPMSKAIVRRIGPRSINHAIAFSIFVSFALVGVWHGTGTSFLVFGALQGVGLVAVHYYTIWLKKRLGRDGYLAYRQNRVIRRIGVTATYSYFAFTLIFFANSWQQMGNLFQIIHW